MMRTDEVAGMADVGSKDVAVWPGTLPDATARALYDEDEFGWMLQQADLLRANRLHEIDRHSLAEYLTEMARSKQAAFRSAMVVLLQHMLKAMVQPEKMTRSWLLTINVQRQEIGFLIGDEPGMRQHLPGLYAQAYPAARKNAAIETGIEISRFPADNPWTMEEVLTASLPEPAPRGRKVKRPL